jgi:hypothetical protein
VGIFGTGRAASGRASASNEANWTRLVWLELEGVDHEGRRSWYKEHDTSFF